MNQLQWIDFQLNSLPVKVLISLVDELGIQQNQYRDMAEDILKRAKRTGKLTDKQKMCWSKQFVNHRGSDCIHPFYGIIIVT